MMRQIDVVIVKVSAIVVIGEFAAKVLAMAMRFSNA